MLRAAMAAVLLALLVIPSLATAAGRAFGRELLQSGVSCPVQIPACMPRRCTTRILGSKEQYVCLRCMKGYVPVKGIDGKSVVQCVCPAGTYQPSGTKTCERCPTGSYCPGGDRKGTTNTAIGGQAINCNPSGTGLTTKSDGASRQSDCIARAGYALPATRGGPAQLCEGSTYAPEGNKLQRCLPCQSGLATPDTYFGPRADRIEVCQVPPGRFWELNVVRDCPQGLYREEYVKTTDRAAIACFSCPKGWTTASKGSTLKKQCNKLLPGFMLEGAEPGDPLATLPMDADIVEAESCPYGFYNDGSAFSCRRCPLNTTTESTGAESVNECLVPPGYYVRMTGENTGVLTKCPTDVDGNGYYRAGWVAPQEATDTDGTTACTPCGKGIKSEYRDNDEIADARLLLTMEPIPGRVASSAASCYIDAGWGMSFDPEDYTKFKAYQCDANTYGVSETVYGLNNAPCKACTKNLRSAFASTTYDECINPVGFGYTSEGANQCPPDFYTAAMSMEPCEQCPPGRYTDYEPGNGIYQESIMDCKIPPGSGVFSAVAEDPWDPPYPFADMTAKPCPIGYYSLGDGPLGSQTTNPKCEKCRIGTSTSKEGSTSCDVCAPGWGIPDSKPDSVDTADCELCDYGTYHPGGGLRCSTCPKTPFNHHVENTYTSDGITFSRGMVGPETCVPKHAQLPAPAGHRMAINESLFTVVPSTDHVDCIQKCAGNRCCIAQYEAKEGEAKICKHVSLPPVGPDFTGPRLYYKLPPSDIIAAASLSNGTQLWAKTQASGVYTRCFMNSSWVSLAELGLIGTSTNPALVEETDMSKTVEWNECPDERACRIRCERNAACWGFIYLPGKGWATRGGEDQIGVRTFVISPDFSEPFQPAPILPVDPVPILPVDPVPIPPVGPSPTPPVGPSPTPPVGPSPIPPVDPSPIPPVDPADPVDPAEPVGPPKCPAGFGYMFDCGNPCTEGTYNNGSFPDCRQCDYGYESGKQASRCTKIVPTKCPVGYGGLPDCTSQCPAGTFNNGDFGDCQNCTTGRTSLPGAGACNITIAPTICRPGKGGAPACNICCKGSGKWNNGSFGQCQDCPAGFRRNSDATGCVEIITKCPPGKGINLAGTECNVKCEKGTANSGAFLYCNRCPDDQTSDPGTEGASSCFYEVCPAGRGDVPTCDKNCGEGGSNTFNDGTLKTCTACPAGKASDGKRCFFTSCPAGFAGDECKTLCAGSGRFNNGSFTTCQSCPAGMSSTDGITCEVNVCPAGRRGNNCDQPCEDGKYNDGFSFGKSCASCPNGNIPNLDRSGCEDDNKDTDCIARPTDSLALEFDCPPTWSKILAGNTVKNTAGCLTPAASSSTCNTAFAATGTSFIGRSYDLVGSAQNGKLVCKCNRAEEDGYVLKRQANGTYACVTEAAFLPANGLNTDSPQIDSNTPGIWYTITPFKACKGAQQCWDMCFFCDGRPRYHDRFLASFQQANWNNLVQEVGDCRGNPGQNCDLKPARERGTRKLFEACREWSIDINHFGSAHADLRKLYNDPSATNRFHTTSTGVRMWPYRPQRNANKNNLQPFGLKAQQGPKSAPFNTESADLINNVLVRYGYQS